jgi:hypothetical protein
MLLGLIFRRKLIKYHKYKYIINLYKKRVSILTEDEARTILIEYANQKCCYGVKPAKELTFTDIQSSNSYRVSIVLNEVRLIFIFLFFISIYWRVFMKLEQHNGYLHHIAV